MKAAGGPAQQQRRRGGNRRRRRPPPRGAPAARVPGMWAYGAQALNPRPTWADRGSRVRAYPRAAEARKRTLRKNAGALGWRQAVREAVAQPTARDVRWQLGPGITGLERHPPMLRSHSMIDSLLSSRTILRITTSTK